MPIFYSQQVKLLIREALGIFGADKTGMVDYALESAGMIQVKIL